MAPDAVQDKRRKHYLDRAGRQGQQIEWMINPFPKVTVQREVPPNTVTPVIMVYIV